MNDDLRLAKENLQSIREEFKDDPELLACYEPSAIHLVECLEDSPRTEDYLIQYFIVNSDLKMSAGKIAAQVARVSRDITKSVEYMDTRSYDRYKLWLESESNTIVVLRGKEKELLKLIDFGWIFTRDSGRTEVAPDSLTVIGCYPDYKSILQKTVKRLRLL